MPVRPPQDAGLCDFLILSPDFALVFEIKFRKPGLACFAPTVASHKKFDGWIERCYFASSTEVSGDDRPGALQQLSRACLRLLSHGHEGVRPRRVFPIVLNPQDMVFATNFVELMDDATRRKGFFDRDRRIAPPVALGLGVLEMLCGCDFGSTAFSTVLREKADNSTARRTAWPVVLQRLGIKTQTASIFRETLDSAFDHCRRQAVVGRLRLAHPT
jgi:hypothetical protein